MYFETVSSPIGELLVITEADGALTGLYTGSSVREAPQNAERSAERTAHVRRQLEEYFAGNRREFDLDLRPRGTPFQRAVWDVLLEIPFGETRSYGQIAARLQMPKASRAIGRANGSNPISIVIPCHRVIGASGDLTGYGGGLPVKKWLLEFEGRLAGKVNRFGNQPQLIGV